MMKKQERYQDLNFKKFYDEDFFKNISQKNDPDPGRFYANRKCL